jgi:ABC-type transporter Mla subunit MlaD
MSQLGTAREALIAEAIGEVAHLLDRLEALTPALEDTRQALSQASAKLSGRAAAFERLTAALSENAKTQAVHHIVHRSNELAWQLQEQQKRALADAAHQLFEAELRPSLQQLAAPLQQLAEQLDRPWDRWLTHAATAMTASAATLGLAVYLWVR